MTISIAMKYPFDNRSSKYPSTTGSRIGRALQGQGLDDNRSTRDQRSHQKFWSSLWGTSPKRTPGEAPKDGIKPTGRFSKTPLAGFCPQVFSRPQALAAKAIRSQPEDKS